ncbi:hypothetical protein CLV75_1918 [Ruegeria conchae]|uniref:Transposase n=1 Tax=Ruegeria conchae TaxID=981384 RepID=A0A497ZZ26_9RHOB|nr:hypothetical protein CLV75_1918 [Ruegeria conchae]
MANKRPKPEEIVSKLRQVEVLMGQGMPRLDAIRQIGVVEQTYSRLSSQHPPCMSLMVAESRELCETPKS